MSRSEELSILKHKIGENLRLYTRHLAFIQWKYMLILWIQLKL